MKIRESWIKILLLLMVISIGQVRGENEVDSLAIHSGDGLMARRVDRGIKRQKFIFKGETMIGLTASHMELSANNAEFMLALTGLSGEATMRTIKPFVGYFYRDNKAIGARFSYSNINCILNSGELDLGSNDVNIDFPYIAVNNESYGYSIFHRTYAPLDKHGHFGLFAELEFYGSSGNFAYSYQEDEEGTEPSEMEYSRSKSQTVGISFNPGITAFVMHNIAASLSFEFGGLKYSNIVIYDIDNNYVGQRKASKMNFKINLLAINFGVTMHIWGSRYER